MTQSLIVVDKSAQLKKECLITWKTKSKSALHNILQKLSQNYQENYHINYHKMFKNLLLIYHKSYLTKRIRKFIKTLLMNSEYDKNKTKQKKRKKKSKDYNV